MATIQVENLFKLFGPRKKMEAAIELVGEGLAQKDILDRTGCTVAVSDISFTVEGPEIFVIMGLSGSGKSTLLRCINRLIEPTRGRVVIDDEDVLAMDHKAILKLREKKTAMVFQHFGLLSHKNVLDNVAFGLELQEMPRKERETKARETLEQVGLADYAEAAVGELSGGMQQRVGLARALATEADILLMDEAFSALDPLIRSEMQADFLEFQAEMPKTILFITHDLSEALMLGDRIAILKDGALMQVGGPEEIVLHPDGDYVESFVENVDRSRVLTAATIGVEPLTVTLDDSLEAALSAMEDRERSLLFVTEDGRIKGVVRLEDAREEAGSENPRIQNILQPSPEGVKSDAHLITVIEKAAATRMPLPVVDGDGRLQAMVPRDVLLRAVAGGASQ